MTNQVAVLGARGFIGTAICRRLGDVAFEAYKADALEWLEPSYALVIAAGRIVRNPASYADEAMLVGDVVHACKAKTPNYIVNISSDAVYGDDARSPIAEDTPTKPTTVHGSSHLIRELLLAELGIPLLNLRCTAVYGRSDRHNSYGPNRFLRQARAGGPVELIGLGPEWRDHIFVEDVAEVVALALDGRPTGVLNAATGDAHSFLHVASTVASLFNVELVCGKGGGTVALRREFDIARLRSTFLGFTPTPLMEGLKRCLV